MKHMLHHWQWRIFFEPRDAWIGLYWKRYPEAIDLYLCLLPMVPLNVYIQWQPVPADVRPEERRLRLPW